MKRIVGFPRKGVALLLACMVLLGCESDTLAPQVLTGTIVGQVVDDSTLLPMSGVQVGTDPASHSVFTDSSGSFRIADVDAGLYEVIAKAGDRTGSVHVRVAERGVTQANIRLLRISYHLGRISGTVVDARSKEPIEGVLITIDVSSVTAHTDTYGRFEISSVPTGDVVLTASHPIVGTTTKHLVSKAGQNTACDIYLGELADPLIRDGLVLFMPLNGDADDWGPGGHHGQVVGDVTFERNVDGRSAAARFDGYGDRIEIPHHAVFLSYPMTIALWMKSDGPLLPDALLVGKFMHPSGDGYEFFSDDGQLCAASFRDGFKSSARTNISMPTTQRWTHIAVIISPIRTELWVNGTLIGKGNWNGSNEATYTQTPFCIGGGLSSTIPDQELQGMNGYMGDVYVFDRPLLKEEIEFLARN